MLAKVAAVGTAAALAALGGQATAAAEQGAIVGAGSPDAVEGSYIVVLKDGMSTAAESKKHAKQYDAKVKHRYSAALRGYSAKMSKSDARALAADSSVAYVEQDRKVSLSTDQTNPPSWGLDRIDQTDLPLDDVYSYDTTASNVTAYIIDTGIRTTHNDFEGRATWGTNTADSNDTDCNGHGTHVAGTVGGEAHGVAKEVDLVAVKVLDCNGSGTYAGVIDGIDWVTANASGPSVANMSLGGGASDSVDNAVRNSINSGVTYALAAGNDYGADACNTSPARTEEAITVGSTTSSDSRSSFSNIGTCLDIFAPGSDITSAWNSSDSSTNTISGTSMATPHVAGGAALYLADNPTASPQTVRDALVDAGSKDKISNVGSGSPNVLLNTGADGGDDPGDPDPPTGCEGSNGNSVPIRDHSDATSEITVSGCDRNASSASEISVDISHTWIGDLTIDLVSPTGDELRLRDRSGGSANDINETYTVDLSAYPADGTWTLVVHDHAWWDSGSLNSWSFTG